MLSFTTAADIRRFSGRLIVFILLVLAVLVVISDSNKSTASVASAANAASSRSSSNGQATLSKRHQEIHFSSTAQVTFLYQLQTCFSSNLSKKDKELYDCVLGVIAEHNQYLSTTHWRQVGPSLPRIDLITYLTDSILRYAVYSLTVNAVYAILHGHHLHVIDNHATSVHAELTPWLDDYDVRWNKIGLLSYAVDNWSYGSDYVMWIDADWIFLDFNLQLHHYLSASETAVMEGDVHIMASAEHAGSTTMINSGSVLVKNSLWTKQFLADWWTIQDRRLMSDQEQFDYLYMTKLQHGTERQKSQLQTRIKILPPYSLNSDPPAMTKQQDHHPVLHLMGEETEYRVEVFRSATEAILEAFAVRKTTTTNGEESSLTLPWQLGATQSQLLTWTKEVYGRILYDFSEKGALINFVKLALKGEASLEQCRKLANIVHHYSHALEFSTAASTTASKAKNEKMEAGLLRLLTYHVLVENVVVLRDTVLRKHQNTSSTATTNTLTTEDYHNIQFPADYPELVKQVVIAGQQMLLEHSQSWEGIHHKEELVELYFPNLPQQIQTVLLDALQRYAKASNMIKEMEVFLQEMLMTSNPKQHHAIYHMIAHMHLQQAERIIHNPTSLQDASMLQEALDHAEESVRISRMLIRYSGHQILIQPLMLLANLLSMLQQLPKAYVIFEEALNILQPSAERSAAYSKAHDIIDFLLPLTLNYGMALVEGRQYGKGRQRLQEAQRLLQLVAQGEGHEPHPQQAMLDLYQQKVNDFLHIASSH